MARWFATTNTTTSIPAWTGPTTMTSSGPTWPGNITTASNPAGWISADDVALDEHGNLLVRSELYAIKMRIPKEQARRLMALIQMMELAGMLPEEAKP